MFLLTSDDDDDDDSRDACAPLSPLGRATIEGISHIKLFIVNLLCLRFKEYMDRQGKFITQAEADARVAQMQHTRQALLERLEYERQQMQARKARIAAAHEEDAATNKKKAES